MERHREEQVGVRRGHERGERLYGKKRQGTRQVDLPVVFEAVDEFAGHPVEGEPRPGSGKAGLGNAAGAAWMVDPVRGKKRSAADGAEGGRDSPNLPSARGTEVQRTRRGNKRAAGMAVRREDDIKQRPKQRLQPRRLNHFPALLLITPEYQLLCQAHAVTSSMF